MNDPGGTRHHGQGSIAHPVQALIQDIHARAARLNEGAVANYIPELAKADPRDFGIAIAFSDGHVYETGDSRKPFTIQSVSKPLVYALALKDRGRDHVLKRIGVEPSGDAFNSISFDERHNRPFNPMMNQGAIVAASLVRGDGIEERFARVRALFEAFAGGPLGFDEAVYRSEDETGHRNRAIAYLELNAGMIEEPVLEHLDLYFRQCSILVTARDIAVMAATLANYGVNPVTQQRVIPVSIARDVLSVMATCGMYDYAGNWQFDVGIPAKSGVGGGILATLPNEVGIGVYSPPLDALGNSVRGIKVCTELSRNLKLHLLDRNVSGRTVFRRIYRSSEVRSKRVRGPEETKILEANGQRIAVYELQGDLAFANSEQITRVALQDADTTDQFILDARRVLSADPAAHGLLTRLLQIMQARRKNVIVSVTRPSPALDDLVEVLSGAGALVEDFDTALENAEDRLIAALTPGTRDAALDLSDVEVLGRLSAGDLDRLRSHLEPTRYRAGDLILREGAPADRLMFLTRGRVDVVVALADSKARYRVATIEAGNMFGELALLEGGKRTADVVAATDVECLVLTHEALDILSEQSPELASHLVFAVARSLAERLRRATREIAALAR
ncbi:MAG: glutaminase A [Pseudorhodoplanes sp.]|nr:glutaminase A [Pseudorhodoplanes sp.]